MSLTPSSKLPAPSSKPPAPGSKPPSPSSLRILFYTPFKPLDHPHPSGDLVTATGIFDFLVQNGHEVIAASNMRCRWIYWKPWLWLKYFWEKQRILRNLGGDWADLWFTYHSYYKAPDLLGPAISGRLKIPYVIFQGIYSTKRRRQWTAKPGFYLNKNTLRKADHLFTNKSVDLFNLKRLVAGDRITYVAPGIDPHDFEFDEHARADHRQQWNVGDVPVIISAAMFRSDVKTEGLTWLIRACGELKRQGQKFQLVIAGDGPQKEALLQLADKQVGGRVRFLGKIARQDMYRFYSAADIFVFPGIRESLGMVFLEAQACGLPVVAFDNAGVPEAVADNKTGLLVPMYELKPFVDAIKRLLGDKDLRRQMGAAAKSHVRQRHDLKKNYRDLELTLDSIVNSRS